MQEDVPITSHSLKEIQASNKKVGRLKTLFDQFQAILPWGIMLIIISTLSKLGYDKLAALDSRLTSIETKIISTNQNTNVNGDNNTIGISDDIQEDGDVLGNSTGFAREEWIDTGFKVDDEGFYCHNKSGFDYWSIWTKRTYPPILDSIGIKIAVKQTKQAKNPPTIAITYGEYVANKSPIQFYRLNLFDTDMKTIRLYNNTNDSRAQAWLEIEPDTDSEMAIKLSPSSANKESRIISINPEFIYVNKDSKTPITFKSDVNFDVELPTVGIGDGSVQKQLGIGSSSDTCFKIIDFQVN